MKYTCTRMRKNGKLLVKVTEDENEEQMGSRLLQIVLGSLVNFVFAKYDELERISIERVVSPRPPLANMMDFGLSMVKTTTQVW